MMTRNKSPLERRLGHKVRSLRRREKLSQAELATRLGISASYLNLIENNKRPLPAPLLVKLAQHFNVDLTQFASDEDARLVADLMEAFADPLFDDPALTSAEVREMASSSPAAARAVLSLYRAYRTAKLSADDLSSRMAEHDDASPATASHLPSEEVSDLIQRHLNHFPAMEAGAEELVRRAKLHTDDLYTGLIRTLERDLGISVQIARSGADRGTLRRFDPEAKTLTLSELLPTRSRTFQLAYQIGMLTQRTAIDAIASRESFLTADSSRALARVALGNYFAGAVLMPYDEFLRAAREERYDIDVIGRRFRVGFEQTCHRLTTLRRPGAEGIPFHFVRIDVGGNISKRFSASGIRIARFAGACPRWNIFAAFLTPGMIRIQVSRMPDGEVFFCLARTIQKDSGGYHAQQPVMAIGLGCKVEHARELVYSDGVDLENPGICVPVGVTCRTCERVDCDQRAFPSLRAPLVVDENVRGTSLYSAPQS
jgi:predicted transcriptional regulator/transcriptional regulator with XRE-family HTH domain